MTQLPCWFDERAMTVANALLEQGFCYCGLEEEFCVIEENLINAGDWKIGGTYQDMGIDAIHDGALFCLDLTGAPDELDFNTELTRIQQLIKSTEKQFDLTFGGAGIQLSLFAIEDFS